MKFWKISFFLFLLCIIFNTSLTATTNEDCALCHEDPELTTKHQGRTISLYVDFKKYSESVHKDSDCTSCHIDADVEEFPHPERLEKVTCGNCHDSADEAFSAGIHGRALKRGAPYAPTCNECHGEHYILPPSNIKSRTYKMNIPVLCGKCHREGAPVARVYNIPKKDILSNYSQSIHGEGLFKRGLIVTATCNDCHGNHLVLPHTNSRSTVSARNIASTCTKCHARIEEVHVKIIKGDLWEQEPGAIPACPDCHQPHTIRKTSLILRTSDRDCLKCHEKEDVSKTVDGQQISMIVNKEDIQNSMHKNIPCVKCHTDIDPRRRRPCETASRVDCSNCHAQVAENYFESKHGEAYTQKDPDSPYCSDCHGKHTVLSHLDERDKTYRANIPQLCGDCHSKLDAPGALKTEQRNAFMDYSSSVHGQGLIKKGLLPSAVCTDCHSAHYILNHEEDRSSTHPKNLPATCGACHVGIERDYLEGVHGKDHLKGSIDVPVCTDCHNEHDITSPQDMDSSVYATKVAEICSSCHDDETLSRQYGFLTSRLKTFSGSFHGTASKFGEAQVANCASCHGFHGIRPSSDPKSSIHPDNMPETCGKCHPGAGKNFSKGKIHVISEKVSNKWAYFVKLLYTILIAVIISIFLIFIAADIFHRVIHRGKKE